MPMYVSDLSHFFNPDGLPRDGLTKESLRLATFLERVVSAATAVWPLHARTTGLPCRRSSGRKVCGGRIQVDPARVPEIQWRCDRCDDEGVITGWQGKPADYSQCAKACKKPTATIELDADDYGALLDLLHYDCDRLILSGEHTPRGIILKGNDDEVEDLVGMAAAEANHASGKRRLLLDKLYDSLEEQT